MRRTCLLLCLIILLCPATCRHEAVSVAAPPAAVALYADDGCWAESDSALEQMYHWMGMSVTKVNASQIRDQGLSAYRLLCIPGGDMYKYSGSLGADGVAKIREFVSGGGGYIGICGGAYFASKKVVWKGITLPMNSLRLFDGTAQGPWDEIVPFPESGLCTLRIPDHSHAITRDVPDSLRVLYYWGPALLPDSTYTGAVLARYGIGNRPAALATTYGRGRVFLIATHPEIEEGSPRDGVVFRDDLADPESEWDLMKNAAAWCLEKP
jgi:glutamine amidotransferase-like uncharacterized protein